MTEPADIERQLNEVADDFLDQLKARYDQTGRTVQLWLGDELIYQQPIHTHTPDPGDTLTLHWGRRSWDVTEGMPRR